MYPQAGRTILTTIHQPSSRMFHMFDKLIILSEGHTLYSGQANEAMHHFGSLGFVPQLAMNPADFLLDLATGNMHNISIPERLSKNWRQAQTKLSCVPQSGPIMPAAYTPVTNSAISTDAVDLHVNQLTDDFQEETMEVRNSTMAWLRPAGTYNCFVKLWKPLMRVRHVRL